VEHAHAGDLVVIRLEGHRRSLADEQACPVACSLSRVRPLRSCRSDDWTSRETTLSG
jgi:hypothetical protein